jgi:nicotinamide mononucleotide (NMN) deamidase PncC
MAPNLAVSQRQMIHDMISSNELTATQMAKAALAQWEAELAVANSEIV